MPIHTDPSDPEWLNWCEYTIYGPDPQDCADDVIPGTSFCPKHWAMVAYSQKHPNG